MNLNFYKTCHTKNRLGDTQWDWKDLDKREIIHKTVCDKDKMGDVSQYAPFL